MIDDNLNNKIWLDLDDDNICLDVHFVSFFFLAKYPTTGNLSGKLSIEDHTKKK